MKTLRHLIDTYQDTRTKLGNPPRVNFANRSHLELVSDLLMALRAAMPSIQGLVDHQNPPPANGKGSPARLGDPNLGVTPEPTPDRAQAAGGHPPSSGSGAGPETAHSNRTPASAPEVPAGTAGSPAGKPGNAGTGEASPAIPTGKPAARSPRRATSPTKESRPKPSPTPTAQRPTTPATGNASNPSKSSTAS